MPGFCICIAQRRGGRGSISGRLGYRCEPPRANPEPALDLWGSAGPLRVPQACASTISVLRRKPMHAAMTKRVLIAIVDDDESIRVTTASLMRSFGYAVRGFASAEEFLQSPE